MNRREYCINLLVRAGLPRWQAETYIPVPTTIGQAFSMPPYVTREEGARLMSVLDGTFEQWSRRVAATPESKRLRRRIERAERLTDWMGRIPLVGRVVRVFWYLVLAEGYDVRDGMSFSFLNDGMSPSLWHTWVQMRHDNDDPYVGIYPDGAPHNRREADAVIARAR